MQREDQAAHPSASPAFIDEPNFYRLGFASQIVVWAMRKRLHLLAHGATEENVLEAFRRSRLDGVHSALMSIVDLLLCTPSQRVQLHNVGCAGLSPHEIGVLNALAYWQRGDYEQSERHLRELFCTTVARVLRPTVMAIVDGLDAGGLQLTAVGHDEAVPVDPLNIVLH